MAICGARSRCVYVSSLPVACSPSCLLENLSLASQARWLPPRLMVPDGLVLISQARIREAASRQAMPGGPKVEGDAERRMRELYEERLREYGDLAKGDEEGDMEIRWVEPMALWSMREGGVPRPTVLVGIVGSCHGVSDVEL